MDDYRDLMGISLVLLSAGIMLVAGELYLDHRMAHPPNDAPGAPEISSPMVSHAPSPHQNAAEPRQAAGKSHQT
ncbi:hypothetical protein [Bradyrhizobium sp. RDM4]|uniref:hypothetical protein n=1 Tax=Bradyrhizobium sp. RDM4 TaxID=3378765 RepID=UPI0038FC97CA